MVKRRLDERGRITIPKKMRDGLKIKPGEEVDIEVKVDKIIIRPKKTKIKKINSGRDWGKYTFLDAPEATFGSD